MASIALIYIMDGLDHGLTKPDKKSYGRLKETSSAASLAPSLAAIVMDVTVPPDGAYRMLDLHRFDRQQRPALS